MPLIDPQENSNEKKEQEDSDKNKQQKNISPFFRLSPTESSYKANAEEPSSYAEPKPMFHLSKDEYVGLHSRYEEILQSAHHTLTLDKETEDKVQAKLTKAFNDMMSALFKQHGATLDINILASDKAQKFIESHASV